MICYLDMDGILANFVRGLCAYFKRSDLYETYPKGEYNIIAMLWTENFWKFDTYDFWVNLEKMEDADRIIKFCETEFDDTIIVTKPTPHCYEGKNAWLMKYFPKHALNAIFISDKSLLANENTILIDDNDDNCQLFRIYNGNAYLYPRPWNKAYAQKPDLRSILT